MSEPIQIAIIVSVPPTIVSLGACITAVKARKAIKEVHISLNSRLDQLIALTKKTAFAEGVQHEQERIK
jgi:hypothetical protein